MQATQSMNTPLIFRFTASTLPAIVATGLLFMLMVHLISSDAEPPMLETREIAEVLFEPEEEIIFEQKTLERPEEPQAPPEPLPQLASLKHEVVNDDVPNPLGDFKPDTTDPHTTVTGTFAIVRVQAVYPNRAAARGIEGYVDLGFDVTAAGTTTNIHVAG